MLSKGGKRLCFNTGRVPLIRLRVTHKLLINRSRAPGYRSYDETVGSTQFRPAIHSHSTGLQQISQRIQGRLSEREWGDGRKYEEGKNQSARLIRERADQSRPVYSGILPQADTGDGWGLPVARQRKRYPPLVSS